MNVATRHELRIGDLSITSNECRGLVYVITMYITHSTIVNSSFPAATLTIVNFE